MKRSALQCVVGFIGASLIVVGVFWTCRQLSSPTQLNAAQGTSSPQTRASDAPTHSPVKAKGALTLSSEPSTTKIVPTNANEKRGLNVRNGKVRSASVSQLNLSVVDSTPDDQQSPQVEPEYPSTSSDSLLDSVDPLVDLTVAEQFDDVETVQLSPLPSPKDVQSSMEGSLSLTTEEDQDRFVENTTAPEPFVPQTEVLSADSSFPSYPSASNEQLDSTVSSQGISEDEEIDFPETAPIATSSSLVLDETSSEDSQNRMSINIEPEEVSSGLTLQANDMETQETLSTPSTVGSNVSQPIPSIQQFEVDLQNISSSTQAEVQNLSTAPSQLRASTVQDSNKANFTGEQVQELLRYYTKNSASRSTPGEDSLSGVQQAQIVVEKLAPEEVQIGQETTIVVKVKNVGQKTAKNVLVRDSVPVNTRFVSASNSATPNAQGELIWNCFDLDSQAEKQFEYRVVPMQEGVFGSVASVVFSMEASSKTRCSRPEIKVEVNVPETSELGKNVTFDIVVSNVGSGTATNVALNEAIPQGLYHPSGSALDNMLDTLKPGESKRISLTLKCVATGQVVNRLTVTGNGFEPQTIETPILIQAPSLELSIAGSSSIYLERTATYKLSVHNSGDVSAFDVRLVAQLPKETTFVSANNLGAYKEDEHSVYWDLAELPAQVSADIELTVKSNKTGQSELVFMANAPNDLTARVSKSISIDGLAALTFNVVSSADPVEVGKEFVYTIQIENRGTKASNNIVLQVLPPEAISILATDGPTSANNRNGVVVFDKIDSLPAKSSIAYKIKANAKEPGDCRVSFQLSSDDLEALNKEESTRVYQ